MADSAFNVQVLTFTPTNTWEQLASIDCKLAFHTSVLDREMETIQTPITEWFGIKHPILLAGALSAARGRVWG